MNSQPPSSNYDNSKWLHLSAIVNQYDSLAVLPTQKTKTLFIYRLIAENLLVFLLQYMGLMLSTLMQPISPIWLASGTACAFIFLRGLTVLPGIWIGSFAAYYFAKAGFLVAFECATIFMFQAQLLLWLSYHYISPTLIFYRRSLLVKFILISAMLTAIVGWALLIACQHLLTSAYTFFTLWIQWWLANFNGILVIACTLITWDAYFPQICRLKELNKVILSGFYGTFLAFSVMLLLSPSLFIMVLLGLLVSILTIMISIYYGWCGCLTAVFLLGLLLSLDVSLMYPCSSTVTIFLQLVLALNTIIGLFIAVMKWEKEFKN